jgi:hypothetical protein
MLLIRGAMRSWSCREWFAVAAVAVAMACFAACGLNPQPLPPDGNANSPGAGGDDGSQFGGSSSSGGGSSSGAFEADASSPMGPVSDAGTKVPADGASGDGSFEAAMDAGLDGSNDAGPDGSADATPDGSSDASLDGAGDASVDASTSD